MNIIRTGQLTSHQEKDVKALETACCLSDQTALSFPMEAGCLSFLLYDGETLLSAFSAYFQNNGAWECTAFTLPAFRRKGCFSRLLNRFLEEAGEHELIFPADASCTAVRLTFEAIGAELLYRELMMERTLPMWETEEEETEETSGRRQNDVTVKNKVTEYAKEHVSIKKGRRTVFHPALAPQQEDTLYSVETDGRITGSFHLIFRKRCIYLYGLEISKPLQNKGFGTEAMEALIKGLSGLRFMQQEELPDSISLQVTETNKPALALYRKMGFRMADSLSYYIY